MTTPVDMDDRSLYLVHHGVGVRRSAVQRLTYDLVAVTADVGDLIVAAGGWLCDRVRAGWHVDVVVPSGIDVRPLHILGVTTVVSDDAYEVIMGTTPAALAVACEVLTADPRIGKFVERAAERRVIEVVLWGDPVPTAIAHHFQVVGHTASSAATAFKPHALAAAGSMDPPTPGVHVEQLHSVGLWYPLDGTDLSPVH